MGTQDREPLRLLVESWFAPAALAELLGNPATRTESMAQDALAQGGKRWRPLLAASAAAAFSAAPVAWDDFRSVAVAVECFHKASLIHDDIEDGDRFRYGAATLHERWGVSVALNVGDLLIGEGYRLIGQGGLAGPAQAAMLRVAAQGHRLLCIGQGQELWWLRNPRPLSVEEVLDVFRLKTAPAFEVALHLGAIYAGADSPPLAALSRYSDALGVAYQISDDLDDLSAPPGDEGGPSLRPNILLALAWESADAAQRNLIERVWRGPAATDPEPLAQTLAALQAASRAESLLEHYKRQALECLRQLPAPAARHVLEAMVSRIFLAAPAAPASPAAKAADEPLGAESAA